MRFIHSDRGLCRSLALVLVACSGAACAAASSSPDTTTGGSAAGNVGVAGGAATAGSGGMLAGGAANHRPPLVLDVAGTGGVMPAADGTPESCDGKDNDSNGIVDDVDTGGDGICDCLSIATVGVIGPWSNGGNVFAAWLAARSPRGVVEIGNETLTPQRLAPFQVIVTLHVATVAATGEIGPHHAFAESEIAAVDSWVRGGGGLMTTMGYTGTEADEVVNINRLLTPLGVGYSTTLTKLDGPVIAWAPHPVTEGVMTVRTDNGVEPQAIGTLLAQDEMNRQALSVVEAGQGRVAVWGDEWITYDSEWADLDTQQVERLWLNLFKWLSPPRACQVPAPDPVK
jgi:hypothetical protein